jgi:hypothetical protein
LTSRSHNEDFILHNIPPTIINHDTFLFLKYKQEEHVAQEDELAVGGQQDMVEVVNMYNTEPQGKLCDECPVWKF